PLALDGRAVVAALPSRAMEARVKPAHGDVIRSKSASSVLRASFAPLMTGWGQKRQVDKADGHVRFPPDRDGLAALVVLPAGSTKPMVRGLFASWMHEHAQSVHVAIRG